MTNPFSTSAAPQSISPTCPGVTGLSDRLVRCPAGVSSSSTAWGSLGVRNPGGHGCVRLGHLQAMISPDVSRSRPSLPRRGPRAPRWAAAVPDGSSLTRLDAAAVSWSSLILALPCGVPSTSSSQTPHCARSLARPFVPPRVDAASPPLWGRLQHGPGSRFHTRLPTLAPGAVLGWCRRLRFSSSGLVFPCLWGVWPFPVECPAS